MCEAAYQRTSEQRLELVELGPVDDPRNDLMHVIGRAHILGNDRVKLFGVIKRRTRLAQVDLGAGFGPKMRDNIADDGQRMFVTLGEMVDHTALARMKVA